MGSLEKIRFSFSMAELPGTTFRVVSYTGHEALSQPFEYHIVLACASPDVDMAKAVLSTATFSSLAGNALDPVMMDAFITENEDNGMVG
jgi:uncharacterized protein involved in type VI secretion and phage assembly